MGIKTKYHRRHNDSEKRIVVNNLNNYNYFLDTVALKCRIEYINLINKQTGVIKNENSN